MREPDIEELLTRLLDPAGESERDVRRRDVHRSKEEEAALLEDRCRAYRPDARPSIEVRYFEPTGQLLVVLKDASGRSRDVIGDSLASCIEYLAEGPPDDGYPVVLDENSEEVCCVCHGLGVKFDELEADEQPADDGEFVITPLGVRGVVVTCPECNGSGTPWHHDSPPSP